jgi:hypothetical protein
MLTGIRDAEYDEMPTTSQQLYNEKYISLTAFLQANICTEEWERVRADARFTAVHYAFEVPAHTCWSILKDTSTGTGAAQGAWAISVSSAESSSSEEESLKPPFEAWFEARHTARAAFFREEWDALERAELELEHAELRYEANAAARRKANAAARRKASSAARRAAIAADLVARREYAELARGRKAREAQVTARGVANAARRAVRRAFWDELGELNTLDESNTPKHGPVQSSILEWYPSRPT